MQNKKAKSITFSDINIPRSILSKEHHKILENGNNIRVNNICFALHSYDALFKCRLIYLIK